MKIECGNCEEIFTYHIEGGETRWTLVMGDSMDLKEEIDSELDCPNCKSKIIIKELIPSEIAKLLLNTKSKNED